MNRTVVYIFAVFATIMFAALVSSAHARLESSTPASGAALETAPSEVKLRFSVRIQPAMSSIRVVQVSSGAAIGTGPLQMEDGGKTIFVALTGQVVAGPYRVDWKALSTDDHMIEGSFDFSVGPVFTEAAAPPDAAVHDGTEHTTHEVEPAINWSQSLVRWLIYLPMILLTGGLSFRIFVADDVLFQTGSFDSRLIAILSASSVFLLVGLLVALALQTQTVVGSINPVRSVEILRETSFGLPWTVQTASVLFCLVLISVARVSESSKSALFACAFIFSLVMLLGSSLSGHARAASSEYSLAIFSDWLHFAAASIWVGGLFVIGLCVPGAMRCIDRDIAGERLAIWISRFTRIAIPATILLLLSGLYNSWIHVDSFPALVGTTYGVFLLSKIGIAGVMVVLGGINALVLQGRLQAGSAESSGRTESRLFRSVRFEALLAIAVLLLAALLAFLPPAREHAPVFGGEDSNIGQNAK